MDGITVLNEMGGRIDVSAVVVGGLLGVFALFLLCTIVYAVIKGDTDGVGGAVMLFLFAAGMSAIILYSADAPLRYEVTLEAGAVIDATQWEIVEKRGEIYVLEAK